MQRLMLRGVERPLINDVPCQTRGEEWSQRGGQRNSWVNGRLGNDEPRAVENGMDLSHTHGLLVAFHHGNNPSMGRTAP